MINIQHDQTTAVTPHRLATIHKSTTIKCCRQRIENSIKLELIVIYRQAMHTTLQTQNRQHQLPVNNICTCNTGPETPI